MINHTSLSSKINKGGFLLKKKIIATGIAFLLLFALVPTFSFSAQENDDHDYTTTELADVEAPSVSVEVFAGTGSHGATLFAQEAQFNLPNAIASLPSGELIVVDTSNNVIRIIDALGNVEVFAGAVDTTARDNFPFGFYRDGNFASAGFNRPMGVAVNNQGQIFIVDSLNHAVRILTGGLVYTYAGGIVAGHSDGMPNSARFSKPSAIAICPGGYLIVADTHNHVIRRINTEGVVTTIAGRPRILGSRDGRADQATFDSPMGVAVDSSGKIFVADTGNHLIRVIENGVVSTVAGSAKSIDLWQRDNHPDRWDMNAIGGFEDGFGELALFNKPMGLSFWGDNLIIADSANHSIRMLMPSGEVVTLAGTGNPGFFENGEPAFHFPRGVYVRGNYLYIADSGNNMIRRLRLSTGGEMYEIIE